MEAYVYIIAYGHHQHTQGARGHAPWRVQSPGIDSGQRVQRAGRRALRVHKPAAHAAAHGVVRRHGAVHVQQTAGARRVQLAARGKPGGRRVGGHPALCVRPFAGGHRVAAGGAQGVVREVMPPVRAAACCRFDAQGSRFFCKKLRSFLDICERKRHNARARVLA